MKNIEQYLAFTLNKKKKNHNKLTRAAYLHSLEGWMPVFAAQSRGKQRNSKPHTICLKCDDLNVW